MTTNTVNYNICLRAGTTDVTEFFATNADGTAMDLTGYDARMQVRSSHNANASVEFEFSTANGAIVITPLEGLITLTIAATQTDETSVTPAGNTSVYDLELYNSGSGEVLCPFAGNFVITPQVTRI